MVDAYRLLGAVVFKADRVIVNMRGFAVFGMASADRRGWLDCGAFILCCFSSFKLWYSSSWIETNFISIFEQ